MGTSANAAELIGKLRRASTNMAGLPVRAAQINAKAAEAALGAAVLAMSGDGRLGRVGRNGAPVGVRTATIGPGRVIVVPRGPVWLVENATAAHLIGAGRSRQSAYGGREAVAGLGGRTYNLTAEARAMPVGPDTWRTGPFIHRGTTGKGRWRQTRDGPLARTVARSTAAAATGALAEVFR